MCRVYLSAASQIWNSWRRCEPHLLNRASIIPLCVVIHLTTCITMCASAYMGLTVR